MERARVLAVVSVPTHRALLAKSALDGLGPRELSGIFACSLAASASSDLRMEQKQFVCIGSSNST